MLKQFNLQQGIFDDPVLIQTAEGNVQETTYGEGWFAVETQAEINAISASITGGGEVWVEGGTLRTSGKAPSYAHQWNKQHKQWYLNKNKEAELKAEQQAKIWEQIKQKRTDNGRAGVFVASVQKWFHTDDPSRAQYTFMRTLPSFPETPWKTMDNSFVKMNRALLDELSMAMFAHEQADFANAERHRLQMLKANDPLAYDFSGGWANTYQEAN